MDPFGNSNGDDLFNVFEPTTAAEQSNNHQQEKSLAANGSSKKRSLDQMLQESTDHFDHRLKRRKEELEQIKETVAKSHESLLSNKTDCLHQIAVPDGYDIAKQGNPMDQLIQLDKEKMAKKYPFELDAFQREAVRCIESRHSVLVSAHTSAGKTAVAEYAIAISLKQNSRVVYTSPIKALSNQKYRELQEEFQDVGLMTGDVTINPNASCMVMTTEILRSMLYRGSELLNEVSWVIFDEVHYMRDKARGVVWEETMILLPSNVRHVFLSATIPNANEFASWIANLKAMPVHVVYTDYRPTPLQHYVFPTGGDGIHLVIDEKSTFKEQNFVEALAVIKDKSTQKTGNGRRYQKSKKEIGSECYKIVKMIVERDFSPCIVFSFSKKDCESYALHMSKLDLNDDEEKELVEEVFNNAINSLSDDDKQLPQVEHMLPLLKRGIGIHHGGLLPLVKEVIEILFQEGLVKVLFATETFAMGLNMPARTVVYTTSRKFDGESFRYISSGEYIQMSGRAGRRGIDDKGIVITMIAEDYDEADLRKMLGAQPDALNSSFHLSYYMILNLLRVEEITPEYIMERSYFQYQSRKKIPELQQKRDQLKRDVQLIKIGQESQVSSYYHVRRRLDELSAEFRRIVNLPAHSVPFLQPGRLVHMRDSNNDYGWGTLIDYARKNNLKGKNIDVHSADDYTLEVLCWCEKSSSSSAAAISFVPSKDPKNGEAQIISLPLSSVVALSTMRVHLYKSLLSQETRNKQHERAVATIAQQPDMRVPTLDPIENMNIQDDNLQEIINDVQSFEERLYANPLHNHPDISELFSKYQQKMEMESQIQECDRSIRLAGQVIMMTELKQMKRVLKRLGYVDTEHVIQTKGRVACEISTADTLVLTELFFNGTFNNMDPSVIAAFLSCMVYTDSPENNQKVKLPEELEGPFQQLQEAAKKVAETSVECGIELSVEDYVNEYSPVLMEITHKWCQGAKFYEICKLTEVYEGTIVRSMRRLEELIRQLCVAAKSIGEELLERRFLETIEALKRDIVFSASLYL
mmetsp:Transcript_7529/g.28276  ORF Transcript_7529/g.28276 Transcript_7529/m.28276 type:complete len:1035 (-) Transcript_7529:78-3182(-)|eukprot:CAMPEP_0117443558 /NCGR_PEP_ID=MMETSP0759-20121206/4755_1 /TAXON_ID=63605 /ORGANISM="Percolomonas cosmopolitus, Strain WS" /LENGTH=1034 /DNA_ID=CAMNT_0005235533 /DNA_START=167 /DNA_END=3271 /DNA_ORIENTATION=+